MSVFNSLNTSSSSLTAQRLRMDVASSNIANAESTRASMNADGEFEPYRRKMVTMSPRHNQFKTYLHKARHGTTSSTGGVKVTNIIADTEPFRMMFNPTHPDANEEGFV